MHLFFWFLSGLRRSPPFDFGHAALPIVLAGTGAKIESTLGCKRQGEQSGRTEICCRGIP
jgi:hypothetical protein